MSDESETPIADALAQLQVSPITDSAEIGAVAADAGGIGVVARVSTTLGKGWSLTAQGQWQHKTGWSVATVARWTKGK